MRKRKRKTTGATAKKFYRVLPDNFRSEEKAFFFFSSRSTFERENAMIRIQLAALLARPKSATAKKKP